MARYPDPKYRAPMDFAEIQDVARRVVLASGKKIRITVKTGADPSPPCVARGNRHQGVIIINPRAAKQIPPNSWAFIIGHEIAHLVEEIGPHESTTPKVELEADIIGARYAMNAGFRLDAYLGWLLSIPVEDSKSHGSMRHRAYSVARHYGMSDAQIRRQRQWYENR